MDFVSGNSVTEPAGVIRAMFARPGAASVTQRLPSGPVVMPCGDLLSVGVAPGSVTVKPRLPSVCICTICPKPLSVIQRLLSGPMVIPYGCGVYWAPCGGGTGYGVLAEAAVRGYPADVVGRQLAKPEGAIRAADDVHRVGVGAREAEFGNGAAGGDTRDLAVIGLGCPEIVV